MVQGANRFVTIALCIRSVSPYPLQGLDWLNELEYGQPGYSPVWVSTKSRQSQVARAVLAWQPFGEPNARVAVATPCSVLATGLKYCRDDEVRSFPSWCDPFEFGHDVTESRARARGVHRGSDFAFEWQCRIFG